MEGYLRRRDSKSTTPDVSGSSVLGAEDVRALPALAEFLASKSWPGGEARETGTLLLFAEDGKVKCCLSDRDQGLVAFATLPTLLECLLYVEEHLVADSLEWRVKKGERRGGRG